MSLPALDADADASAPDNSSEALARCIATRSAAALAAAAAVVDVGDAIGGSASPTTARLSSSPLGRRAAPSARSRAPPVRRRKPTRGLRPDLSCRGTARRGTRPRPMPTRPTSAGRPPRMPRAPDADLAPSPMARSGGCRARRSSGDAEIGDASAGNDDGSARSVSDAETRSCGLLRGRCCACSASMTVVDAGRSGDAFVFSGETDSDSAMDGPSSASSLLLATAALSTRAPRLRFPPPPDSPGLRTRCGRGLRRRGGALDGESTSNSVCRPPPAPPRARRLLLVLSSLSASAGAARAGRLNSKASSCGSDVGARGTLIGDDTRLDRLSEPLPLRPLPGDSVDSPPAKLRTCTDSFAAGAGGGSRPMVAAALWRLSRAPLSAVCERSSSPAPAAVLRRTPALATAARCRASARPPPRWCLALEAVRPALRLPAGAASSLGASASEPLPSAAAFFLCRRATRVCDGAEAAVRSTGAASAM
mmetsp:Transcript_7174/g.25599  ORF Transcript_7174/g.25599 Transcript_7174/m.25599 type:complete len:479 (-) Transcript_7174:3781-5217(-)